MIKTFQTAFDVVFSAGNQIFLRIVDDFTNLVKSLKISPLVGGPATVQRTNGAYYSVTVARNVFLRSFYTNIFAFFVRKLSSPPLPAAASKSSHKLSNKISLYLVLISSNLYIPFDCISAQECSQCLCWACTRLVGILLPAASLKLYDLSAYKLLCFLSMLHIFCVRVGVDLRTFTEPFIACPISLCQDHLLAALLAVVEY